MHIVILGNGIAGITAAIHLRRWSKHQISVISEESPFFFARTALMYVFMGHIRQKDTEPYERSFWEKHHIRRIQAKVSQVLPNRKSLLLSDGRLITYDNLILASGSRPAMPGIPGEQLPGIQGFYHLRDLERLEAAAHTINHALIIGGGLIGIELAEMLHARHIPLTMLIREAQLLDFMLPPSESAMADAHVRSQGITIRPQTLVSQFNDAGTGQLTGVSTMDKEEIKANFAAIAIGVSPEIAYLDGSGIETRTGILTDAYLRTSDPDIFAAGDVVELRQAPPGRRPTEALWYTARQMGECVARNICQTPEPYRPGLWYNSAKFFHLEYQVYGHVPLADKDSDYETLYWQHPQAQKSIRIAWHRASQSVSGFLLMGIRYRQDVCEQWISSHTPIKKVLEQLPLANFDPEFSARYEKEIQQLYQP